MYSSKVISASRERLERRLGQPLREYSLGECQEMAYRMKDLPWELGAQNVIPTLPEECQEYILNELQLSKIDFEYWANRYAHLIADTGKLVKFSLWPSQRDFLNMAAQMEEREWDYFLSDEGMGEFEVKIPIILLKSRQVGGTVVGEVLLAHMVSFFQHTRAVIASDGADTSLNLSRKLLCVFDNLPPWMKPRMDARVKATNFHFSDIDCDVQVGQGNQTTTLGQGNTIDFCHFTELSTWENSNAIGIEEDMLPAFKSSRKHHSFFVLESTGQGGKGNWFHDTWQAARSGKGFFKPLFVGWFRCPNKFALRSEGVTLSETTKAVGARIERENALTLTKEQLSWYQKTREEYEAVGRLEIFLQEYPSSPEEAFQSGLKSVFSIDTRAEVRDGVRLPIWVGEFNHSTKKFRPIESLSKWILDPSTVKYENKMVVWEWGKPGALYVIGCDSSYGIDGGDSSAIEVVRVGTASAPDEQVAEWYGSIEPSHLGDILWAMGHMWMDKRSGLPAKMAIERQPGSPGIVPHTDLMRRGYPHFYLSKSITRVGGKRSKEAGWSTTAVTRPLITEGGCSSIRTGDLIVNSLGVVEEMGSFISTTTPTGMRKLEHAPGYHDDRLFALFIAYYVAHEMDTLSLADARRREEEMRNTPPEKIVQWNQLGISWEEAISRWRNSLPQ